MKPLKKLSKIVSVLVMGAVAGLNTARAAQYFTDADGPLSWDATTANWSGTSSGTYDALWASGDAVFEGTGGIVNVSPVNAGNLTFNATGYNLSGGTIELTGGTITATSAATIGSVLAGSVGMAKAGTSVLTLSSTSTYTGNTSINAGTLKLNQSLATILGQSLVRLDASDPANLSLINGKVTTWNDLSGNGYNVSNASSTNVPFTDGNGRKWVKFDGTANALLTNTAWTGTSGANFTGQKATMFVVWGLNGSQSQYVVARTSANNDEHWRFSNGNSYFCQFGALGGGRLNTAMPTTGNHITTFTMDGSLSAWEDADPIGTASVTGSVGAFSADGTLTIGGGAAYGPNLNGYVGEVLIFNSVLTAAQRQQVYQYLNYKWFGVGGPSIANALPAATPLNIASGGTLDLNGSIQQVGALSGSGTLTNSASTTGTLTFGDGSSTTFSSAIVDAATGKIRLVKDGAGTTTLSGNNNYRGGTSINAGSLKQDLSSRSGAITTLGDVTVASGAVYELLSGTTIGADTTLFQNNTFRGTGTIRKTGTGYIGLAHSGSSLNSFNGTYDVQAGIFGVNNGTQGTGLATVQLNGATTKLDIRTGVFQIDALTGVVGSQVYVSHTTGGTLNLGNNNGSGAFAGTLDNVGSALTIIKNGSGTQILSGANTYTGATTISGGALKLTGGSLGNTAIAVGNGTTLAIQPSAATTINLGNTATTSAGATLALGANTFDMTDGAVSTCNLQQGATFAGNALTIGSGAILKFNLGNSGSDLLAVTKAASVGLGTVNVTIDATGATSAIAPGTYNLVTAASGLSGVGVTWQFTGGGTTKNITVDGAPCTLTLNSSATAISLAVTVTRTLTYNGNNNDGGTAPVDGSSPYLQGSTVTALAPGTLTKTGYAFTNWNTQANGSGTSYNPNATFTLTGDTSLYAQWTLATATVSAPGTFPAAVSTTYGTTSGATSVSVSGSSLTTDIIATAPTGLEVSSDGSTYGPSATFTQSGGSASGMLYVRIKNDVPVSGSPYDDKQVTLLSTGAPVVYVATTASGNTVAPKALMVVSATAANKLYDGTTAANVIGTLDSAEAFGSGTELDGKPYTGATLTVNATGVFASPGVGNGISVTAGTFALGGASAGNYTLTQPTGLALTANILGTAVWTQNAGGSWPTPGNWQQSIIGTGTDITADFSTLSLPANETVTLDGARIIGNLIFDDQNTIKHSWTLNPNITGSLTLAVSSGAPSIANNVPVTLSTVLAGNQGLAKSGTGTLTLSGANTSFTGGVSINGGTLQIDNASALSPSTNVTLAANSTSSTLYLNALTTIDSLTVGANTTGAILKAGNNVWGPVITGTVTLNSSLTQIGAAGGNLAGVHFHGAIVDGATHVAAGQDAFIMDASGHNGLYWESDAAAANTFTGNVHIKGGLIRVQRFDSNCTNKILPPASLLIIDLNSSLQWANTNNLLDTETFDGLSGGGSVTCGGSGSLAPLSLVINANNSANDANRSFSGTLVNLTGPVTFGGTRKQTFSGPSIAYPNATIIDGGTLELSGTTAFASSAVTVNGGKLLVNNSTGTGTGTTATITVKTGATLAGAGSVGGATTIEGGGFVAPGTTDTGTLTAGTLTLSGTYQCQVDGANSDKLAAGNLTLTGATLAISTVSAPTAVSYLIGTYTHTGTTPVFTTVTGVPAGYTLDMATAGEIKLVGSPAFNEWATNNFLTSSNGGMTQDADGDGFSNLMEFAFGTNPLASSFGAIIHSGGVVTGRGQPTTSITNIENGGDYRAVFVRREDFETAGLTYTVQFSSDFTNWTTSDATPDVVASDGEVEVVTVPYLLSIPAPNGIGTVKPTFFRVGVSQNP